MKTSPVSPSEADPAGMAYRQIHLSGRRPRRAAGGPATYDRPTDFFIGSRSLIDLLLFRRRERFADDVVGVVQHTREHSARRDTSAQSRATKGPKGLVAVEDARARVLYSI